MIIYHYHPETGEYLGTSTADPNPLSQGSFLIPAYAVRSAPPAMKAGHALVYAAKKWTHVADHRGETWWNEDSQPVVIEALGDPAELGLSDEEPPAPEPEPEPEPEPVDPLTLPLTRLQFWLTAAEVGVSKWSVRDKIAAMPDGPQKLAAIAFFEDAEVYRRQDPLLIALASAEGIGLVELDALWVWAVER